MAMNANSHKSLTINKIMGLEFKLCKKLTLSSKNCLILICLMNKKPKTMSRKVS